MDTKNFNLFDRFIAKRRLNCVLPFIKNNEVILDFGCGSKSYLLDFVKERIKKGVGVDYEVLNKKIGKLEYINLKFFKTLPFKNEYFDKVFLLAVLEHIESDNVERLFSEFKRILKNNGSIVLTTPTPKSKIILEFLAYKLKLISEKEIRDHKKYYSKEDLYVLGRSVGLKLIGYKLFQFGLNSCVSYKKND